MIDNLFPVNLDQATRHHSFPFPINLFASHCCNLCISKLTVGPTVSGLKYFTVLLEIHHQSRRSSTVLRIGKTQLRLQLRIRTIASHRIAFPQYPTSKTPHHQGYPPRRENSTQQLAVRFVPLHPNQDHHDQQHFNLSHLTS